jgi:ADP-ribose pyrophosphatase
VRWPNSSESEYNVVEIRPSVFIVPITAQGEVVLIHNYRHPLGKWCWELPAGGIEDGQTPLEAAQAELLQEAGGVSEKWQFLFHAPSMNGIGNHIIHYFLARDVQLGPTQHEGTEAIKVQTFTIAEALSMARSGAMQDVQSIAGMLAAEPLLY